MAFADYWYVVAESKELEREAVLSRRVLGESLVCFRGADGGASVLRDRCLHRNARLSAGRVRDGRLQCPYHGWIYDGSGQVVAIPSMAKPLDLCATAFAVLEQDGFVYTRLSASASDAIRPFAMPHANEAGWGRVRLQNRFRNDVGNCVENFIDIPHTVFVHDRIFRVSRGERIEAQVVRENGEVHARYANERANLGTFARLLNPRNEPIVHTDSFYAPNVTSVRYELPRGWVFAITSQAIPFDAQETHVYTELAFRFGAFSRLAAPLVRRQAQRVIDQDVEILGRQSETIARYGRRFTDTPADVIHRYVDSLREAIAADRDPKALPRLESNVAFYV